MLRVDGLECNNEELSYCLKYYRKHKKEFKQFENNHLALQEFLSELVREYRVNYGYRVPVKNRLKFGDKK